MITLSRKLIYYSAAAIFLLVSFSGCAQTRSAVKDDNVATAGTSATAVIKTIKVSSDASQIEILADKPLSYTYYKTIEPPKVVIDIAQTDPGSVAKMIEVHAGNIKRIEVAKHEFTGGFLSRIEVIPTKEVGDFSVATDSVDKGKLLITFAKSPIEEKRQVEPKGETKPAVTDNGDKIKETQPQSDTKVTKAEPKTLSIDKAPEQIVTQPNQKEIIDEKKDTPPIPVVVPDSNKEEKQPAAELSKDAKPAANRIAQSFQGQVLSAITASNDSIEITVNGGVETFNAFKLTKPDRIVLDLRGVKNGINVKSIVINKFGVGQARLGNSPGKVRIVFDALKDSIPAYQVIKDANGLKVVFGEVPEKVAGRLVKETARETVEPGKQAIAVAELKKDEKPLEGENRTEAKPAVEPMAAPAHQPMVLNAISASDEGIEISIDGGIDTYSSFKLTKPDRIVLDIPGVKNGITSKLITINKFGVGNARLGSYPDKVRIVLDAAHYILPSHQIMKSASGLKVLFTDAPTKTAGTVEKQTVKETAGFSVENKGTKPGASIIDAIDFSIVGEYSQIAVKVGGDCSVGKISQVADGLALTIHNCQVPGNLQRMINTGAFPSVVQKIVPYQVKVKKGHDSRILVKLRQKSADNNLKVEANTIYWKFRNPENIKTSAVAFKAAGDLPKAPAVAYKENVAQSGGSNGAKEGQFSLAAKPGEKKVYTGRRVSLEFSDADIRKILQLIAEVSNLNFLIGDDVSGTLSIKLVNVPWDQALEVILETKGLEKRQEGNIMYIKPKGKFKTEEQEASEALKEHERRMDLITKVFEINFASVDDIAAQFDKLKSDRGTISKDARTNRVIVTDIDDKLGKMAILLKTLDTPEKQVMIEARIVEAQSTFARDLGVQWGIHYSDPDASVLGISTVDVGLGGIITPPPAAGTFISNLAGGAAGFTFGKLASNVQLDLRLSASAVVGQLKVISTPKVLTLNNKTAKISQGTSIPYQSQTAAEITTIFVEAALTLEVTPHVAADGTISMKIKATNNSAGANTPNAGPQINKKEATTEVQVMNGETVVIGGIYQDSDSLTDSGVPFLMDIPLLGWLFKSNAKNKTKTELLIFVTPKIVS